MPEIKFFTDHSQRAVRNRSLAEPSTNSGTPLSWALRMVVAAFAGPAPVRHPYADVRFPVPLDTERPKRSDPTRRLKTGVDKLSFPMVREAMEEGAWFDEDPRGPKPTTLAHRLAASDSAKPHFADIAQIVFSETDFNGQRVDLNMKNAKGDPPLHTALLELNTGYFAQLALAIANDPTIPLDLAAVNRDGKTIWQAVPATRPYAAINEHLKEIRDVQTAARRSAMAALKRTPTIGWPAR